MKGSRYSEEQIIGILREAEAGLKTAEVCRRHGTALIAANNPRGDASPFLISKPIMILYGDAGMAQFTTLTEQEEQEFWRLYRFYWREAERCEEAKAYLAACVMLGSALEALLVLMINVYDEEADATGRVPTKGGKSEPLLAWDLAELLRVAKATNWLPTGLALDDDWNSRKAKVGDYAEVVRMIRNLAHPGRYVKEHLGRRVTKKYLQRQFDVVDACRDWLSDHNNRAVLAHMTAAR